MVRIALIVFAGCFVGIILLADQGRGFWGFLDSIPLGDKLGHLVLVGTLAFLLNLHLKGRRFPGRAGWLMLGSGIVAALMTVEECSQLFVPHRTPDALDGLANLLAAALAQLAALPFTRRRSGRVAARG